jgi:hypothetical protein
VYPISIRYTDDEVDSHAWNEIESELDAEFLEDHGFVEEVTPVSQKIMQSIAIGISSRTELLAFWLAKLIDTRSNSQWYGSLRSFEVPC